MPYRYALIRGGAIVEERDYPEPLDPASIKREGGQLYLVSPDGARRTISEEERARVIAPYRVKTRVEKTEQAVPADPDGEPLDPGATETEIIEREILSLDGVDLPGGLPADALIGDLEYEGGRPVLRPVVEIKPPLGAGQQYGDVTVAIYDDRVEQTHAVIAKRFQRRLIPKLAIVDRLDAAGLLDAALDAIEADRRTKARWDAASEIANDDPTALALLAAIGADPAAILAAAE